MLREHKGYGVPLRFYDAVPDSGTDVHVQLDYAISPDYISDTAVEYSEDGSEWIEYTGDPITLQVGNTLYFRAAGDNRPACEAGSGSPFGKFTITGGKCKCGGDIMSLLDRDMQATIAYPAIFLGMFKNQPILTAPEISASEYRDGCFKSMFEDCSYMTDTVPVLHAEELAQECCSSMFYGCSSMESTPDMKFKITATKACESMFEGCSSVTKVVLRNLSLTPDCFKRMFYGCLSLNYIKCNFIRWPEYRQEYISEAGNSAIANATLDWTYGVAPVGTFVRDYRLPLYINNKPGSGTDPGTGFVYNWDEVHSVAYVTTDMYNFDPWIGKESGNETTIPECAVMYRTIKDTKSGFTATFKWLSSYAVTGSEGGSIVSSEIRALVNGTRLHADPDHAGLLCIDELLAENFNIESGEPLHMTPDHEITIDWGDGYRTILPKLKYVDPTTVFSQNQYSEGDTIGGIFQHTYAAPQNGESGQYIISVCSDDIDEDTTFTDKVNVIYNDGLGGGQEYIGCMPPLVAGAGSNIDALLTPFLPMYRGNRADKNYYPMCCLFYRNTQLVSVPASNSKIYPDDSNVYGYMFYKCKNATLHPEFAFARMFDGCTSLKNSPALFIAEPNSPGNTDELPPITASGTSTLEGFMRNCGEISEISVPFGIMDTSDEGMEYEHYDDNLSGHGSFGYAEFIDCKDVTSKLKTIHCGFFDWPDYSEYLYPDTSKFMCFATYNWTRNVYDEYGTKGTFICPFASVASRVSEDLGNDHEHEYNPWSVAVIPDDWFLTFTNNTQSAESVTLKNQRKLFASLIGNKRLLNLKVNTDNKLDDNNPGITLVPVENHGHLLEYRKSKPTSGWYNWLEITDDTLSNGVIHSDAQPSNLSSESGFDFVWSVTLQPGEAVQLRGVPGMLQHLSWIDDTTLEGRADLHMNFIKTNFYSNGGDAGYWEECDVVNTAFTDAWSDIIYTERTRQDATGTGWRQLYKANVWRGSRMLTGINNRQMYYQFYGCNGLDVTGKIDTFFDWLDIRSRAFTAPPYTYFRLFKGTGIVSAPDIFAYWGPDRGEFAECFRDCASLTSPARMNLSPLKAVPHEGPAPTVHFNYVAMNTTPYIPGEQYSGIINVESSSAAIQSDLIGTKLTRNLGQGWYYFGNYITPHPKVSATSDAKSCQGAFEGMYRDCVNLEWPTVSKPVHTTGTPGIHMDMDFPLQLGIAFVFVGNGRVQDRSRTMKDMFNGCKKIGTFGLYTYGKTDNSVNPKKTSNLKWHCMHKMFYDCCNNANTDYLWNCFYTCLSLKHFSWYGENPCHSSHNGSVASWEGGGPYENWLGGTTNVAKIYTNCAIKPYDWSINPITSVTRGDSHVGTCKNSAWEQAAADHFSELASMPALDGPGDITFYDWHKTLAMWNATAENNPLIMRDSLTWLTNKDFTNPDFSDWEQ